MIFTLAFRESILTLYLVLYVVPEEDILDAGFKMRIRHPNFCETSSHPISAPTFMLSKNKIYQWRLMMLWFGKECSHAQDAATEDLKKPNCSSDLLLCNKIDQSSLDTKVTELKLNHIDDYWGCKFVC